MKRNSKVLAKQLRKLEDQRIGSMAVEIDRQLTQAQNRLDVTERQYDEAVEHIDALQNALKKFNKSGDTRKLRKVFTNLGQDSVPF